MSKIFNSNHYKEVAHQVVESPEWREEIDHFANVMSTNVIERLKNEGVQTTKEDLAIAKAIKDLAGNVALSVTPIVLDATFKIMSEYYQETNHSNDGKD